MATPEQRRTWGVGGLLVALGLVFGDIGTSPLYVFQAIIGTEKVTKELILGSLSCVFWTLILITTFKYVYLALKTDNRGEGGILALMALATSHRQNVSRKSLILLGLFGAALLFGDGIITVSMSAERT